MRKRLTELTNDAMLARDLHDKGEVLLRAGSVLTQGLIGILKRRGIVSVDIIPDYHGDAPGAGESYRNALAETDPAREQEKAEMQAMFGRVAPGDSQMQTLEYCMLRHMEELYHGEG